MSLYTVLIVVLILVIVGALPVHSYSHSWGYYPSTVVGLVVLVLIIMLLLGRLP